MPPALSRLGLLLLLIFTAAFGLGAACNHGRSSTPPRITGDQAAAPARASLRLYYLVDLDGYLEPCGCQSRPLGGIDRLARFLETERAHAPNALVLASGNLLYRDVRVDPRMAFQEDQKADSLVHILDQIGLAAFAPGPSDFARGAERWQQALAGGHVAPLAANAGGGLGLRNAVVREVGGVRVGVVGVSDFHESADLDPPAGAPATSDPVAAARDAVAEVRRQGARVVVVLASVPRRVARTIAGDIQGVDFVIAAREESSAPAPPERIGSAYLVTAANQGKSVGVLDLFLRADGTAGLTDASAATADAARRALDGRIADLRTRLAQWEQDPAVDRAAVAQQRTRLAQLEHERQGLAGTRPPPATGSYFDARLEEVSPDLPKRADVEQTIATYFHAVNEHNREAYASLRTPPPAPGQAGYVGNEQCRDCHEDAYQIWIRTPHSRAYNTLAVVSKNFNLSCVGCHVTGYQRPGGAEVVQNAGLQDVQCESCHGPGSLHVAARTDAQRRATIRRDVPGTFCAGECHTAEHSDHFDYATYRPRILGPGHGFPVGSHEGGVSLDSPILQGGATPSHDTTSAPSAATDAGASPAPAAPATTAASAANAPR